MSFKVLLTYKLPGLSAASLPPTTEVYTAAVLVLFVVCNWKYSRYFVLEVPESGTL
jgi:hypothetical protein